MSNEALKIDLDGDGVISKKEEEIYERKAKNRRMMAWLSLVALIASGFSLMFFVPESRLSQLNGILELYWLSLGGIVGAYVGMSAWASRK
jgi:cytochrome bd-type quinol oxidase subunit 2